LCEAGVVVVRQRFPASVDGWVVAGAAAWALTVVFFVAQAVAQAASTAPYSLARNYISDLGNTACGPFTLGAYHEQVCSPLHGVMNAAFVVAGILMLLGAAATWRAWPARRLAVAGLALLALGGAGQALAGLCPENVDLGLHTIGAVFGIGGANIGVLLLGLAVWRVHRPFGMVSVLAGAVGLVGFLLTGSASSIGLGIGTVERIAAYPLGTWTIAVGVLLLWSAVQPR
jgi:hypothetical membrane protein